jgi:hypothetical protein
VDDQVGELSTLVDQEEDPNAQEWPPKGRRCNPLEGGHPARVEFGPQDLLLILLQYFAEFRCDVIIAATVKLERFSATKVTIIATCKFVSVLR